MTVEGQKEAGDRKEKGEEANWANMANITPTNYSHSLSFCTIHHPPFLMFTIVELRNNCKHDCSSDGIQ